MVWHCVSPGVINTPFHEVLSTPEMMTTFVKAISLGRVGTPVECARVVRPSGLADQEVTTNTLSWLTRTPQASKPTDSASFTGGDPVFRGAPGFSPSRLSPGAPHLT